MWIPAACAVEQAGDAAEQEAEAKPDYSPVSGR
jgi:hypothetical protein